MSSHFATGQFAGTSAASSMAQLSLQCRPRQNGELHSGGPGQLNVTASPAFDCCEHKHHPAQLAGTGCVVCESFCEQPLRT